MTVTTPEYFNGDHRNENEVEIQRRDSIGSDIPTWKVSIDDFNLLTIIGRGSYAKVVQAEHKETNQIYAIKIIKKEMFLEDEETDWIQTEKVVFTFKNLINLISNFFSQCLKQQPIIHFWLGFIHVSRRIRDYFLLLNLYLVVI